MQATGKSLGVFKQEKAAGRHGSGVYVRHTVLAPSAAPVRAGQVDIGFLANNAQEPYLTLL